MGGLKPPSAEDEEAAVVASQSGVIFILEDADLQVGKVGTVCFRTYFLREAQHQVKRIAFSPRL